MGRQQATVDEGPFKIEGLVLAAVAGGPLGRLFDGMIGREIAARFAKDLALLKTTAERDAGG